MRHLVIIGAGQFGRELFWHACESIGFGVDFDIKGYIDDSYLNSAQPYNLQKPVLASIDNYSIQNEDVFICAIGSAKVRETTIEKIRKKGGKFITLINKTSIIQGNIYIGEGTFIGPYTVIGDNVSIGNHVILNSLSSVGHDTSIGDYTCVMSHVDITGCCVIGKNVYLASGCRMTPSTEIGDGAYIGIGSVVLRRVRASTKVFGNPAKRMDF